MKQRSLFDIISPVMTGPSSSHTAGAVRLGLMARSIYDSKPRKVSFVLYNSYAETGLGHGTDKGLLAGFLGYKTDSSEIKNIFDNPLAKSFEYKYEYVQNPERHPNSVDFIIDGDEKMLISGNSVGAGSIEIIKINEFSTRISGEYNTLIMFYKDKPGMISTVTSLIQKEKINIASLECDRNARGQTASMCICLDGKADNVLIDNLKKIPDVYFVRSIAKPED